MYKENYRVHNLDLDLDLKNTNGYEISIER